MQNNLFRLYVNSWGRAKEDLKNRSERCPAHSCFLGERGAMKNPVSEVIEAANAKLDTLYDLYLVVTALCEAVSVHAIKGIQNFIRPVMYCFCAGVKLF